MYPPLMPVEFSILQDRAGLEQLRFVCSRPIFPHVVEWPENFLRAPHYHEHCQLIYGVAGVMEVATPNGTWVVPPQRAVWMPSNVVHQIQVKSNLSFRSIYVHPSEAEGLPQDCCVLDVSLLLRALILAAAEISPEYETGGRDERVFRLILDEIHHASLPHSELHLPQPKDARLCRIAGAIRKDPANALSQKDWSEVAGASERTINRLFLAETGMTFGQWRRQARLLEAVRKLADGESIINISIDLGYDSPSAFTAMFRKSLGKTPSQFFPRDE